MFCFLGVFLEIILDIYMVQRFYCTVCSLLHGVRFCLSTFYRVLLCSHQGIKDFSHTLDFFNLFRDRNLIHT